MNSESSDKSGAGFWAFCLEFWGKPGVEPACLELQDAHGADVALALLALYLAARGRRADSALAAAAQAEAARWTPAVTAPVRAARRTLAREGAEGRLRARLREAELAAERILLERLEALAADAPAAEAGDRGALAGDNLAALIGPAADSAAGRHLAQIGSGAPDEPV